MKPLADYSHIRGFNYTPSYAQNDLDFWNNYRHDVVDREMGYAQRLGLNSARIFLAYKAYLRDPRQFQENLRDFVQTAWAHGISTTPILYCGGPFYPDFVEEEAHDGLPAIPSILKPENYHLADAFFDDVYQAVGSEPGLLFWDIANEPGYHTPNFVTFYPEEPEFRHLLDPKPQDMEAFRAKQESVWAFIRHAIAHVRQKDPVNALGVGNTYAYEIEPSQTAPLVDVLIFHNYFETRKRVRDECEIMKRLSQKYNKPVVNNECCCLCRSNPYDMELEILAEYGFGFYRASSATGGPPPSRRTSTRRARPIWPSAWPPKPWPKPPTAPAGTWSGKTPSSCWRPRSTSPTCWRPASTCPCGCRPRPALRPTAARSTPTWTRFAPGCTSWCSSCGRSAAFWAAAKATAGFNFYRGKSARTFGPGAFSFAACMGRRRQPVHQPPAHRPGDGRPRLPRCLSPGGPLSVLCGYKRPG